jgi:hypothetical protein
MCLDLNQYIEPGSGPGEREQHSQIISDFSQGDKKIKEN